MSDYAGLDKKEPAQPVAVETKASGPPRQVAGDLALAEVKQPEDVDRLKPDEVERAADKEVAQRILRDVFKQSWHLVKEKLVEAQPPSPGVKAVREGLARKLIDYRNWSYPLVLEQAGKAVNEKVPNGYTGIKNKGSTELTSDVDLMLQGEATELVVRQFNALFKQGAGTGHKWEFEPGIVLDVNAYEKGYVTDPDQSFETQVEGGAKGEVRLPIRQGARVLRPEGGIGDPEKLAQDRKHQTAAAMLKVRLYMTGAEWDDYEQTVLKSEPETIATLEEAHALFVRHYEELAKAITGRGVSFDRKAGPTKEKTGYVLLEDLAKETSKAGEAKASGPDEKKKAELPAEPERAANMLMAASNRMAEEVLEKELFPKRRLLQSLVDRQNSLMEGEPNEAAQAQARGLESRIQTGLVEIRQIAARVQAFANEAYLTDAGLHHAVVGIQSGQKIQLTKSEGLQVVLENMGDALKELGRYAGDPNEALYKSGKYMLRLADAAKSMGYGYIGAVQILYDMGRQASVTIKGSSEAGRSQGERTREYADKSAYLQNLLAAQHGGLGPTDEGKARPSEVSVPSLRKAVIEAATSVQTEYQLERRWIVGSPDEQKADEKALETRRREVAETVGRPVQPKAAHAAVKPGEESDLDPLEPQKAPGATLRQPPRERKAPK